MKGALCLGSSASLPAQTVSRDHMLNTKILYPSKSVVFRIRCYDDDEDYEDNDEDAYNANDDDED